MPLQPMYEVRPFTQWALYFIGVLNPNSSARHKFILTTMDYCTCWIEAQAYKNCTTYIVIKFLDEHIITRFGIQFSPVCDNGPTFSSAQFIQWAFEYKIVLKYSSNYYPQGNGVAESTNKNLLEVIKRLLENNPRDWHTQLKFALWVDRTRIKVALGNSPFKIVYGLDPIFPVNLQIRVLRFVQEFYSKDDRIEVRLANLLNLEEQRDAALQQFSKHQAIVKRWFEKRAKIKAF
jgi:transposase InsO family protein